MGQMTAGGDQEANLATCTRLAQVSGGCAKLHLFLHPPVTQAVNPTSAPSP